MKQNETKPPKDWKQLTAKIIDALEVKYQALVKAKTWSARKKLMEEITELLKATLKDENN